MLRYLAALILLLTTAIAGVPHTQAAEAWCFDDPVISINGRLLDIQVQMPVGNLFSMRATAVTVIVPRNVSGQVVLDDVSAFPMATTISATGPAWSGAGAIPVTIQTYVTADSSYATRVVATPLLALNLPLLASTTAAGVTNSLIRLATTR